MIRVPSDLELEALDRELKVYPSKARDNFRFARFFSYADRDALFCREVPVYEKLPNGRLNVVAGRVKQIGTRKLPLRRRQWIETYCMIRAKSGVVHRFILNSEQRDLEALICRMERARMPVRVLVLKSRQIGISTYFQAVLFEQSVRRPNSRAMVVAHDDPTAAAVLGMADLMKRDLPYPTAGESWVFDMRHDAKGKLVWREPLSAQMTVQSAKKKNPGIGITLTILHTSETAKWEEAEFKIKEMFRALPDTPGTFGFMESTAQGDSGYFHRMFWRSWEEVLQPLAARRSGWSARFYPWYMHEEYRWTKTFGTGREVSQEQERAVRATLTQEEEWLLKTTYLRRWNEDSKWVLDKGKWRRENVGHVKVSIDQLLWRREKIAGECNGDPMNPSTWDAFYEDYPARPEQAFLSSGRPVFDPYGLRDALREVEEPLFRGEIVDESISLTDFKEADLGLTPRSTVIAAEVIQ